MKRLLSWINPSLSDFSPTSNSSSPVEATPTCNGDDGIQDGDGECDRDGDGDGDGDGDEDSNGNGEGDGDGGCDDDGDGKIDDMIPLSFETLSPEKHQRMPANQCVQVRDDGDGEEQPSPSQCHFQFHESIGLSRHSGSNGLSILFHRHSF